MTWLISSDVVPMVRALALRRLQRYPVIILILPLCR